MGIWASNRFLNAGAARIPSIPTKFRGQALPPEAFADLTGPLTGAAVRDRRSAMGPDPDSCAGPGPVSVAPARDGSIRARSLLALSRTALG